jgi:transposase InsO family protein
MPWKEVSIMSLRWEFVELASQAEINFAELCRRFQLSRNNGYKWVKRYQQQGVEGLANRSHRPRRSPQRSPEAIEQKVLSMREEHPAWGARKIGARLKHLGEVAIPAPSTIHAILRRHHQVDPAQSARHQAFQRFEHDAPNRLWQMDFKGHFALGSGQRCYPLTVLDDHSRYALCLQACRNQQGETVKERLTLTFRCYGLPERMLMDNGAPWGNDREHPYTPLTVWLLRLGIGVSHSRPYHPQTQGKEERFHRTLQAEVLQGRVFADFDPMQQRFDQWRQLYNQQRPHQALAMQVPARRYQVSPRPFPEVLPVMEYGPGDQVRRVQDHGKIFFQNQVFRISKAFRSYLVALRPTPQDGVWEVYFGTHKIAQFDLKSDPTH